MYVLPVKCKRHAETTKIQQRLHKCQFLSVSLHYLNNEPSVSFVDRKQVYAKWSGQIQVLWVREAITFSSRLNFTALFSNFCAISQDPIYFIDSHNKSVGRSVSHLGPSNRGICQTAISKSS